MSETMRISRDVLGEPSHVLALAGEHPTPAVDVEARVNPASQHPARSGGSTPLSIRNVIHPCPEEVLQGLETALGHDVEDPRTRKQPVGHQVAGRAEPAALAGEGQQESTKGFRTFQRPESDINVARDRIGVLYSSNYLHAPESLCVPDLLLSRKRQ
jgi:hypothetical protein